ncbi:MAG: hypothetical protein Kow0056_12380 [Coriobacteriia bacterium]
MQEAGLAGADAGGGGPVGRSHARRTVRVLLAVLALVVVALAATVYFAGGQQNRPQAATAGGTTDAASDQGASGDGAAGDSGSQRVPIPEGMMSGAGAPEGGVEMPLIPIPGCKCHSDDPAVVEEHAQYTLSDCAKCH